MSLSLAIIIISLTLVCVGNTIAIHSTLRSLQQVLLLLQLNCKSDFTKTRSLTDKQINRLFALYDEYQTGGIDAQTTCEIFSDIVSSAEIYDDINE